MRKWLFIITIIVAIALVLGIALLTQRPQPENEVVVAPPSAKPVPLPAPEAPLPPPITVAPTVNPAPVPLPLPEPQPGHIRGQVLQPDGLPAAAADVSYHQQADERQAPRDATASESPPPEKGHTQTDEAGRFELANLPRSEIVLTAHHESGQVVDRLRLTAHQPLQEVTLILAGGESLAGHVVARDGQAIAGARVMPLALNDERYFGYESEGRAVLTDDTGAFRLVSLDPGAWILHAAAEGYGAVVTEAFPAGTDNARIVLAPGIELPCQVLLVSDNTPVENVTLTLAYSEEDISPTQAQSDATGTVHFLSIGPGAYEIDVKDAHYAMVGPPVEINVDPTRKPETVLVYVSAGGEIRGHLRDGNADAGIPGMVMQARQKESRRRFYSAPTDLDGAYALTGLPAGTYTVSPPTRMPGYPQDALEKPRETVTVSEGQISDGVDFVLTVEALLRGIVLDADGNPVAGATVRANATEGRQNLAEYYTAEDGLFQFGDYVPGELVDLVAETRVARSGLMGPFTAGTPEGENIELSLNLACDGVIAGQVVDRNGQPFACKVMAIAEDDALQFPVKWPSGDTDALGNFVLPEVCAGTYVLHLVPRSNARQESQRITVQPGADVLGLRLQYDQGELFEISGIVTDMEGNPVPGARLRSSFANGQQRTPGGFARADENGVFRFTGLPEGTYQIQGDAEGYAGSEDVLANAGDEDVVVVLIPAPQVSGNVTDAGGAPVTAFAITPVTANDTGVSPTAHHIADENGFFALTLPYGGVWTLRVEAEGHRVVEVDLGNISLGKSVENIQVKLPRAN